MDGIIHRKHNDLFCGIFKPLKLTFFTVGYIESNCASDISLNSATFERLSRTSLSLK